VPTPVLDGALLAWLWALPFIGILLTIALAPLLFSRIWSRHYGKLAMAWSALTVIAIALAFGIGTAFDTLLNVILLDYMSFIALLFSLYVVAGGIVITGNFHGTPAGNAGMLFFGTLLASFVGTTGAAMIAVRPLIRANEHRRHNAHVFVFAIFLVANVGGLLTPLGNPPLFIGFLHGVDFFWPAQHLFSAAALLFLMTLAIFVLIDAWYYRREHHDVLSRHKPAVVAVRLHGLSNVYLLGCIIAAILLSATWKSGTIINIRGTALELQKLYATRSSLSSPLYH
jgi:Na+/H+ antiporter NhaD/arsenite permease-like protein